MKYYKEIIIIEGIIFTLFWLKDEYFASLLTAITVPIFLGVFVVSIISEGIERSKISSDYFKLMLGLSLLPTILFILFLIIAGGSFDWMTKNI
jgi:hypothetical protein